MERILINGEEYFAKRSIKRNKHSYADLKNNIIDIRLSHYLNKQEKERTYNHFKRLFIKKILKGDVERTRFLNHQDVINVLGTPYMIEMDYNGKRKRASIKNNIIRLKVPEGIAKKTINNIVLKALSKEKSDFLIEHVTKLNDMFFKSKLNKVDFRLQRSRWGSCSVKNNINISSRLLLAPLDVFTYVCIHELAHLKEFNHSKRFWALVKKAMPDYKEKIKWLHQNESMINL